MYEKIITTGDGTDYLRDPTTGLWIRSGEENIRSYYVGSINPKRNDAFDDSTGRCDFLKLTGQIYRGTIRGFTPHFREKNRPLGLYCTLDEITLVESEIVMITGEHIPMHVGNPIIQIHQNLPPWSKQQIHK